MTNLTELKKEIDEKRRKVEAYRDKNDLQAAQKEAKVLNKLVDEYEKANWEQQFRQGKLYCAYNGGVYNGVDICNKYGVQGDEYNQNFFNAFRSKFSNAATLKLHEGTLPQGGYLLPTEFAQTIQSALEEENAIRKIATIISTESEHLIPYVATKPTANWISEGQTIDLTTETFDRLTLGAHKLATAITLSNELLADSYYDLQAHLTLEFAKSLAKKEEEAFLGGDGSGKPTGILTTIAANSDCWKETQTAGIISADDLINLQYSVRRPYRRNACFLTSDETLAQIRKLKDSTQNFIWQPSLLESEPARLFGQPIFTSPYMPSPESGKICVLYGDFSYYVVAERGQRMARALRELFALQDISAFLMVERIDGKLTDLEAIRGLKIK